MGEIPRMHSSEYACVLCGIRQSVSASRQMARVREREREIERERER